MARGLTDWLIPPDSDECSKSSPERLDSLEVEGDILGTEILD